MRITGWHVDAFGALRDVGVQGLPDGLVVLHGPNEAGKSTLLAFLQRTLFGHPHRNRQDVNHYEPVDGGPRSGRVHLEHRTEGEEPREVVVERRDGQPLQVRCSDGTVAGQAALDEVVHGADQQLFNAVFAFDLDDLRSIDSLSDEAVRDRLFSAGVRGAGRSARGVISHLEREARQWWTPRSRTAEIDRLQDELTDVSRQLDEAIRTATSYPERLRVERHWQDEVAAADALRAQLEDEERRVEALLRAWPVWQRRESAAREFADLADVPELADDVLERHERLCAGLDAATERVEQLQQEQATIEERLAAVVVDERLLELRERTLALDAERSAQQERLESLRARDAERQRLVDEVERATSALGPSWSEGRRPPLEPLLTTRGVLRDWEARLEAGRRRRDETERELRERTRERDQAVRQVEEIDASLAALEEHGPLRELEDIERDRERLVQLRVALLQRNATSQAEQTLASMPPSQRPPRWLVPAIGVMAAGLAVAGVLAALQNATALLTGLVVAATLLLAVAGLVRWRGGTTPRPATEQDTAPAPFAATIDARAAELGLPERPDFEDAESLTLRLEQQRTTRLRADQLVEARQLAATRRADAETAHRDAERSHDQAAREAEDVVRRWHTWCQDHGLEPGLDPATVGDLLTEWERIADRRERLETLDEERRELRTAAHELQDRVTALLRAAGRPAAEDPHVQLAQLRSLAQDVEATRSQAEERRELERRRGELAQALERETRRRTALARDRDRLLAEAGVDDEDGLRATVERSRRRAVLRQQLRDADRDLDDRLGELDDAEELLAELGAGDREGWVAARDRLRADRRELQQTRDDALEALLEARHEREQVETSQQVAELEQRRQVLLARRDELVDEWRVARAARLLVGDTLESFERERQPAVLHRAGEHVSEATAGRYRALLQRGDELLVLDDQQRTCTVDQLSRGTAEQLYLCLRLALAEDLSERGQRLPFVMDDVLVNLDPLRSEQLAGLLGHVARTSQILYFTCHPHMVELLQRTAGAAVYDLPRGGGTPIPRPEGSGHEQQAHNR